MGFNSGFKGLIFPYTFSFHSHLSVTHTSVHFIFLSFLYALFFLKYKSLLYFRYFSACLFFAKNVLDRIEFQK